MEAILWGIVSLTNWQMSSDAISEINQWENTLI